MQNISQHLKVLRDHEIIVRRREGRKIYYCIAEHELLRNCPALHRFSRSSLIERQPSQFSKET
jgi:DNA-binding transcriptional ArsR family regulator